jgi:hypothetical protein
MFTYLIALSTVCRYRTLLESMTDDTGGSDAMLAASSSNGRNKVALRCLARIPVQLSVGSSVSSQRYQASGRPPKSRPLTKTAEKKGGFTILANPTKPESEAHRHHRISSRIQSSTHTHCHTHLFRLTVCFRLSQFLLFNRLIPFLSSELPYTSCYYHPLFLKLAFSGR